MACLAQPPVRMVISGGSLMQRPDDWQDTGDRWRVMLFDHEGHLEFRAEHFPYQPGTLFILPPRCRFVQGQFGYELELFHANFELEEGERDVMALPFVTELGDRYPFWRAEWLDAMRRLTVSTTPARAMIFHLLWLVAEPASKLRQHPGVERAEALMREHMADPISIEWIARESGLSQNHLIRMFRQQHGMTPIAYLRNMRAEESRRLLRTTEMPIKDVAAAVGIPDLHAFNKFVREYFALGPRALRERDRQR